MTTRRPVNHPRSLPESAMADCVWQGGEREGASTEPDTVDAQAGVALTHRQR